MKKSLLALPILLGIIVLISVPSVMAQSESGEIPSWIKGVANFWIEGGINDAEFIEALEFMIDNNVIKLGENVVVDNTMSQLQKENNILQEKLDVSEEKRRTYGQDLAAQHKILYDEKDARYDKLKADYDERTEQKSKEYREAIQKLEDKIKELED